ncbi:P-loop NTPase fold protein [Aquimarina sp. D1M17]|uniref:P-loop NTPase fold protein n=1 Tax=Aquimarina acroporae TaxID=2937283 RepID=UPI0020C03AEA|nr:P-loop NTPase fold protein [Aquimarina acroporae]MCK8520030.1 P-loop NTPase fold protein [Aquimarina acroporae]
MQQPVSQLPYEIILNASPNEADMAIASVDIYGNVGKLNLSVLTAYGYNQSALKTLSLEKGFDLLEQKGKKPILFIVTYNTGQTSENSLRTNFTNAVKQFLNQLSSKTIWIPLLGTGQSGIPMPTSLRIIRFMIEGFSSDFSEMNTHFIISVPDSHRGRKTFEEINSNVESSTPKAPAKKQQSKNVKSQKSTDRKGKSIAVNRFLKDFKGKFYLAGSYWERGTKDQTSNFIDQNKWQQGLKEKTYVDIINEIEPGDILILKSTYGKDRIAYLKIKGFGIVSHNPQNGSELKVDWVISDLDIHIENLGTYRGAIIKPTLADTETILSHIDSGILNNLITVSKNKKTITTVTKITTLAGLVSDADSGTDHLNINKDVSAFARVIAAKSFTPPLAIALFGKWGSGKSFFMRKLKQRIHLLSENNPEKGFCEGIAHVHFNAWSYMDANLWAGIITKIFDGLNQYIQDYSASDIYKQEIEKVLTHELNITNTELEELERKKDVIDAQLDSLKNERTTFEQRLKNKIREIKKTSIIEVLENVDKKFKVQDTVENAITTNLTIIKNKEQFSEIVPKEYWKTPEELHNQTTSILTFLKVFFKAGKWKSNLIFVIAILAIVLAVPPLLNYIANTVQWTNFEFPNNIWYVLTIAGTFYTRGIKTYKQLQPLVASFWKIKEDYELQKEDALFQNQQREKALTLEIEQLKVEIIDINHQIHQTTEQKAEIEFRLNNTLSTEALHAFIEKRSSSKEYEKHLGLISIIRKDFEILSNLFTDHHEELKNLTNNEDTQSFRDKFSRPLERIILYIDDLDRCPEERVVEVLEAVNLLMAYPLFVVVVGVDPRWIKNALIKKHQMQFVASKQTTDMEMIDPASYLEKIFQVPFNLKSAEDESVKYMLKTLAQTKSELEEIPIEESTLSSDDITSNANTKGNSSSGKNTPKTDPKSIDEEQNKEEEPKEVEIIETKETIESLRLSELEIELLQEMSDVIGTSPRAIKRFVNIYRIVKAHEDFTYKDENNRSEIMAVLLLLAIPIGKFKKLYDSFETFMEHYSARKTLSGYFENNSELKDDEIELSKELKDVLSHKEGTLAHSITHFKHHHPFIIRFAFNGD